MAEYFKNGLSILDGGLSTELERNGFSFLNDPLWSARLLQENPEAIVKVHKSYLKCGADILTTASYQGSIPGFQKHLGTTLEESKQLLKLSVELAKKAIREQPGVPIREGKETIVAGSVGPYGAALADGSEYSGNYCNTITHEVDFYIVFGGLSTIKPCTITPKPTYSWNQNIARKVFRCVLKELIDWHRPRIECLIEAGADILAFETIPALKEAEALMKLLKDFPNIKAWLSFSSQSMHKTSYGENISTAALTCMKAAPPGQLVAVGVNCCPPEYALSLLNDISSVSYGFPLIVYPNSGEMWNTKEGWTGDRSKPNHMYLESWINSSAKIIGGCCRTTPEDIFEILKYVQEKKL